MGMKEMTEKGVDLLVTLRAIERYGRHDDAEMAMDLSIQLHTELLYWYINSLKDNSDPSPPGPHEPMPDSIRRQYVERFQSAATAA